MGRKERKYQDKASSLWIINSALDSKEPGEMSYYLLKKYPSPYCSLSKAKVIKQEDESIFMINLLLASIYLENQPFCNLHGT